MPLCDQTLSVPLTPEPFEGFWPLPTVTGGQTLQQPPAEVHSACVLESPVSV